IIGLFVYFVMRAMGELLLSNLNFKSFADFAGVVDSPDPQLNLICRCERVTEAEIIDSLHRGIRVDSIDAVGRRTRAGYGSCQNTFCGPRLRRLIARELNIPETEVAEKGKGSSTMIERAKRIVLTKM
ncbi:MAG: (2Fe-2S)-binding protein, partial [Selenomonadaceae bacterium]